MTHGTNRKDQVRKDPNNHTLTSHYHFPIAQQVTSPPSPTDTSPVEPLPTPLEILSTDSTYVGNTSLSHSQHPAFLDVPMPRAHSSGLMTPISHETDVSHLTRLTNIYRNRE
jgi:hypothetical protein